LALNFELYNFTDIIYTLTTTFKGIVHPKVKTTVIIYHSDLYEFISEFVFC